MILQSNDFAQVVRADFGQRLSDRGRALRGRSYLLVDDDDPQLRPPGGELEGEGQARESAAQDRHIGRVAHG